MPDEKPEMDSHAEIPETGASESPESGHVPDENAARPASDSGPSVPKANVLNRVIAKFIDVLLALLLARLPGYVGFMAGLGYLAIADGLFGGMSVGKRVIGLVARRDSDGAATLYRDSIMRNSTVCVWYALLWVPFVGWALSLAGAGFELLLMIGSPAGKRMGDEVASTSVFDLPQSGTAVGPAAEAAPDTGMGAGGGSATDA